MWLIVIYRPHTNACNLKAVMKYYLPRKFNICYLVGKETTITTWQIPALTRYSPRGKVSWHQAHWELTITGNLIGRWDEGRQSRLTYHSQGFFQEGAFSPSLLWFARSEELNFTDAGHFLACWRCCVAMIISWILFPQYESNRDYSENFMSVKISHSTIMQFTVPVPFCFSSAVSMRVKPG